MPTTRAKTRSYSASLGMFALGVLQPVLLGTGCSAFDVPSAPLTSAQTNPLASAATLEPDAKGALTTALQTWYLDADTDTYGDPSAAKKAFRQPVGYVSRAGDCNDTNAAINPAAAETCDGIDQDCDGLVDDGVNSTTWYKDADGDGYGDITHSLVRCGPMPAGYVSSNSDCNDLDPEVHPNAVEQCDGVDQDCDSVVDEELATTTWYDDADGDSYGSSTNSVTACSRPDDDYVQVANDCDDQNASVNPGAYENKSNGRDDDCDQIIDEKAIWVEAGYNFSLALMSDGTVWSWGDDSSGRLGNGYTGSSATAVRVVFSGTPKIVQICTGDYHAMALDSNGNLYAWGSNSSGQLGNGGTTWSEAPTPVKNFYAPSQIACGANHSLAIKDGSVYAWGDNAYGQLGDGTTEDRYVAKAIGLGGITRIAGGWLHSLAIDRFGIGYAWGYNNEGQLGIGSTSLTLLPANIQMPSGSSLSWVAGGSEHSSAVSTDGRAWGWGDNSFSEIGDCTNTDHLTPVPLTSLTGRPALQADAGMRHSLLLMSDHTVYAWGLGSYGALGYGGTTSTNCPIPVSNLYTATQVSAGEYHSLALLLDGSVYAWGRNKYGELGDGTYTQRNSPVTVMGF